MIKKSTTLKEIEKLTPACSCDACNHGCKFGSGILADGDKERLAKFLGVNVEELEKRYLEELRLFNKKVFRPKIIRNGKPYGKCIFFNGKCKVHPAKPLQCKIAMGCKDYGEELIQWFNLNYILDKDDPEGLREWAISLEHNDPISGAALHEIVKDQEKLDKIMNYGVLSKEFERILPKFRLSKKKL